MDRSVDRQRINLNVDGVKLPMEVLRTDEAPLRRATDAINSAAARYREQFERTTELSRHTYLAMAALELARRAILAEDLLISSELGPRLSELNVQAERILTMGLSQLAALELS